MHWELLVEVMQTSNFVKTQKSRKNLESFVICYCILTVSLSTELILSTGFLIQSKISNFPKEAYLFCFLQDYF